MTAIPDRAHLLTEQPNPRSGDLHRLEVPALVALFNRENRAAFAALEAAEADLTRFIQALEPGFLRGGRLVYLGAGTSGRLAVLDASEVPPTFQTPSDRIIGLIAGGDGSLRTSSEGKEDDPLGAIPALQALHLGADDAVLGIAAGGTTPYVLGALLWAKGLPHPPRTGLLSCSPVAVPPACDHLVVIASGPEVITGSTRLKAGTATKLALNTISTALMVRLGKVYGNLMVDVRASNAKLRDRAARIISTLTEATRDEAFVLLDATGGQVKPAVVMRRLHVSADQAQRLLTAADGHLGRVLDG